MVIAWLEMSERAVGTAMASGRLCSLEAGSMNLSNRGAWSISATEVIEAEKKLN